MLQAAALSLLGSGNAAWPCTRHCRRVVDAIGCALVCYSKVQDCGNKIGFSEACLPLLSRETFHELFRVTPSPSSFSSICFESFRTSLHSSSPCISLNLCAFCAVQHYLLLPLALHNISSHLPALATTTAWNSHTLLFAHKTSTPDASLLSPDFDNAYIHKASHSPAAHSLPTAPLLNCLLFTLWRSSRIFTDPQVSRHHHRPLPLLYYLPDSDKAFFSSLELLHYPA